MNNAYARTQPIAIKKWTDQTDRVCREPIRTLYVVSRGDYDRPTGPVDTAAIKRELGTHAPGPPLNLRPRTTRRLTWRETIAHLLRIGI